MNTRLDNLVELLRPKDRVQDPSEQNYTTPAPKETSMQEVARRVCHMQGHHIGLPVDEILTKRATYAGSPQKEVGRERTLMCIRCGMGLAEIRGENS
jgi:hypothetical protein